MKLVLLTDTFYDIASKEKYPRCARSPDLEPIHLTLTHIKNHYL